MNIFENISSEGDKQPCYVHIYISKYFLQIQSSGFQVKLKLTSFFINVD